MAQTHPCPACGGTGTCPRCGGSGGGDSAETLCPRCRGTGDCHDCDGEGSLPDEPENTSSNQRT
jgi:hypothetical protein